MNESTNFSSLDHLAHEFAERLRRGDRPTVEEYAEQHPQLAAEIRDFFPTLLLMEAQLTPASSPSSLRTDMSGPRDVPAQLGDYRILREVGRGGMGVVYEAVQETLGRHVALKVLPPRHMSNAVDVERFRREARAAAQLHHTNIVPVFDVGEADGVHFYAMQFIDGQPLNHLLDGTQRRPEHHSRFALGIARWQAAQRAEIAALANRADRGIGFQPVETAGNHDRLEAYPTFSDTKPVVLPNGDTPAQGSSAGDGGCRGGSGTSPEFRQAGMSVSGTSEFWRKPLPKTSNILPGSRRQRYLHVARIGKQVAEALAYAHGQGILHRDIKPANLLLDSRGVVWIADFGLARVEGLDELTSPGDVVGTLRYLPPERFEGHSDERGDIYGVGITLYELLTSQPAFTASTRATLIDNILHASPGSPKRIDPHIPRDLETIVLKAMAADPSQRYARAEALAADLHRFIEDRPILARRLSPWGHTWRWCRRNKALAALISLAAALLVTVAVVSLLASVNLREQLKQTIAAQRDGRKQLFDSLVVQARANWKSGIQGKRFQTLKVLRDATRIARELELLRESFDQLRIEAIAALCLTDVEIAQTVDAYPTGSGMVDFDPQFEHYARGYVEGHITIHRISDNEIIHQLPSPGPKFRLTVFDGVVYSPNGQYVSQHCAGGDGKGRLRLWDISGTEARTVFDIPEGVIGQVVHRPDSQQMAVIMANPPTIGPSNAASTFGVHVFDTTSGRECGTPLRADETTTIVFHPWLFRLAVSDTSTVRIIDLDTGAELSRWDFPNTSCLAWSPDGRQLFTASRSDRLIHRWDISSQQELLPLAGHRDGSAYTITFSHAGDLVLTTGINGLLMWELRSGRLVWETVEGTALHMRFSRDDRLLAGTNGVNPTVRLLRVASGHELQRYALGAEYYAGSPRSVLSADGRLLAATSRDGTVFIDVVRGTESAVIPGKRVPLLFEPDGSLLTFARLTEDVVRWPRIAASTGRERIALGPKQKLNVIVAGDVFGIGETWSASDDGRVISMPNNVQASKVFVATSIGDSPTREYRGIELPQHYVVNTSVSPNGRWVAASSNNWQAQATDSLTTTIWESATGRRIKDFPISGIPKFSPDGQWLAIGSNSIAGSVGLWKVGSWAPGPTVEPVWGPGNVNVAFDPKSQLMAVQNTSCIRLVDPSTGREVTRLTIPEETSLSPQCFTPDGTRLIAFGLSDGQLYIWDLRAIRAQLAELGLDWNAPPYDPAPEAELPPPLEVEVVQ